MKNFLKNLWKRLFCKTSIVFVLGGVLGALGMSIDNATLEKLVCLFNVAGCQ